jgi:hypothetical protein
MADDSTSAAPSTAPASAAPAAPAAPAPAAAPATTPDVKRPTSFGAALRDAAKADSSSAAPASAEASAATTVLPTDAAPATTKGPVPYDRFFQVNSAKTAAEERLKEFETRLQQLSWADGLDRQLVHDTVNWRARAHTDPIGFFDEVMRTAPPQVQQQLRSAFARQLALKNDPEPQPDVQTDTGQPVYSAKQQVAWFQWQSRRQQAEWDKKLEPLMREAQQGRQLREQARQDHQVRTFAVSTAKEATAWPHFKDHASEIVAELQKLPPGETEAAETLNLHKAYLTVLKRSVLPGLSGKTEAAVLANLKTKAVAGSEHPGRAGTAEPTRPKSMGEAFRRELVKAGYSR